MRKTTTQRSGCLMLFGLVLFLAGTGLFAFQAVPAFMDYLQMRHWTPTEGMLTEARLETHQGDDSTTNEATASYTYDVGGHRYRNDRVAILGGADNVGEFQQEFGNLLEQKFRDGQPVTVWYNPDEPSDSVLNREIRWGLMGFFSVFLLTFGGAGAGIIYLGWRGQKVLDGPQTADKPWLTNPAWQENGEIRSSARGGRISTWAFAVLWNLVSLPLVFVLPQASREEGAIIHIFWMFPLIGAGMLLWAITRTREWRRFGKTILTMDPFPGSVDGDVGGVIAVNMAWDPAVDYQVSLTCLHSTLERRGKNRSRRETPVWQDSGQGSPTVGGEGIRIRFRFAVPPGIPVTEKKLGNDYHLWRLNLFAELPGPDLDRSYEIPVFATGARSRGVAYSTGNDPACGFALPIEELLPMERNGDQVLIRYPAFRNPVRNGLIALFGGVFVIIGVLLWGHAEREGFMLWIMGVIFSGVGGLVAMAGLYALLNSLEVLLDGRLVSSVRRLFGIPLRTRRAAYHEIYDIRARKVFSGTAGKRAILDFSVEAHYPEGTLVLAQHLGAHSAVKTAREYFGDLIGVAVNDSGRGVSGSGS